MRSGEMLPTSNRGTLKASSTSGTVAIVSPSASASLRSTATKASGRENPSHRTRVPPRVSRTPPSDIADSR